ncbi:MAG: 16S rRNA (cytosine(1402)-N(4))-methyltransferase RsmH, partial [Cruoricaptor ignavus]|nr:16S rRNA (cytosine(1402)-N(4))-methyltransferase RsmH [Cruoricaptor ignavus]
MYHNPVLLKQSVEDLVTNPDGVYVDCTFGGGGHSREILSRLSANGKLFAFDQDMDALENKIEDDRFTLINQNFRFLENSLLMYGISEVDGVLADLGVSSHQFDEAERGFSTRSNAPLDMRMNVMQHLDAKKIINEYEEEHLADIFYHYGELREARKLAREIVHQRKSKTIETTEDLKKMFSFIPPHKQNKFFAQVFQAVRIEVNQELDVLKEMLLQ